MAILRGFSLIRVMFKNHDTKFMNKNPVLICFGYSFVGKVYKNLFIQLPFFYYLFTFLYPFKSAFDEVVDRLWL